MDNSYHTFSAGGVDWLVLSLIFNPSSKILAWANEIARKHPKHRIILLTHAYLATQGVLDPNIGQRIWDEFAKKHVNMTFVFNGHYINNKSKVTASRLISKGENGNKVYQFFLNYQDEDAGKIRAKIRLMRVDLKAKTVSVRTYDTLAASNPYPNNIAHTFTLHDVDLTPP